MTNQSGIEELYGCLTNQSNEILDWWFLIKLILAITLLICSLYLIVKKRNHQKFNRKQIIFTFIFIDVLFYLTFQLSNRNDAVYFLIPYFQFLLIGYIIYYFGRKSILLASFNGFDDTYTISPSMQIKLSQLMYFGLVFFFTTILILNYIDYFISYDYHLCQAQFFNIITTVGFLLQGLFFLQIRQLTRQIQQKIKQDDCNLLEFTDQVRLRLRQIWVLVIVNIVGSFVSFAQNIYFVLMNQIYASNGNTFTCLYVNTDDARLNNLLNSLFDLVDKLLTFFLPYFFALYTFWYQTQKQKPAESSENETYIIEDVRY